MFDKITRYTNYAKTDVPASVVVFLVALPLCLGIALASNAPLFSGVIAGIVGGIVIGYFSSSHVSVSGPAAGLTFITLTSLKELPTFEAFLVCVLLAGVLQIIFAYLRLGVVGEYVPSSVIKGMLAAIGLIIIFKQIPHLVGYDVDYEGDEAFFQPDGENTFTEIIIALQNFKPIALIIGTVSIIILILWDLPFIRNSKVGMMLPGPIVVVLVGIFINMQTIQMKSEWGLYGGHMVTLPVSINYKDFLHKFHFPDFNYILNGVVWLYSFKIAVVASIESLLSIEASDKLDTYKRFTRPNVELRAQGIGNIISGLLGGLPLTAVIVRSSANVAAGARTKMSTIMHGILLLLAVYFIPDLLNLIPLSSLAAILIIVGFKLTKPSIFKLTFKEGMNQFVPFLITICAILFTDLLIGIIIGIVAGLFFILRSNFNTSISVTKDGKNCLIKLKKDVSFLSKAALKAKLEEIEDWSYVIIDATNADFIDHDIIELVNDYIHSAHLKAITVEIKKTAIKPVSIFKEQIPFTK